MPAIMNIVPIARVTGLKKELLFRDDKLNKNPNSPDIKSKKPISCKFL